MWGVDTRILAASNPGGGDTAAAAAVFRYLVPMNIVVARIQPSRLNGEVGESEWEYSEKNIVN